MVEVNMLDASYGDTFVISINEYDRTFNIVIDAGYCALDKLYELSEKLKVIDLFVITHLHADHIANASNYIEKVANNKDIKIKEIWYNGLKQVYKNEREQGKPSKKVKELIKSNFHLDQHENENHEIGIKQALSFVKSIHENDLIKIWNKSSKSDRKEISVESIGSYKISKSPQVTIHVLTPKQNHLDLLRRYFVNEIDRVKRDLKITDDIVFDEFFEYKLANKISEAKIKKKTISFNEQKLESLLEAKEHENKCIINKSSISFIIETENHKMLFLADAHPSDIRKSLKKLIDKNDRYRSYDVIKLPHHASDENMTKKLLALMDAPKYLISTNGKHPNENVKHPGLATLMKVIARDGDERTLYFNYNAPEELKNRKLQKKYSYIIKENKTSIKL